MSKNKKYYWLKLKDNFFSQKEIKKLRKIAGGDTYTIIYLKLQLLSLKNEGKLVFEGIEETFEEEMALELDEDVENVKMTILFLQKYKLMEVENTNEFTLPQTIKSIGSETQVAERVRRHRKNQKLLQCNTEVTNCNTEIDIDIDIDIEKELNNIPFTEIINYLNQKAEKNYKSTTRKTQECIKARCNEGFKFEDFKKVIDIKTKEWLGTKWEKFLRPETLFGPKFEGYLNQKGANNTEKDRNVSGTSNEQNKRTKELDTIDWESFSTNREE